MTGKKTAGSGAAEPQKAADSMEDAEWEEFLEFKRWKAAKAEREAKKTEARRRKGAGSVKKPKTEATTVVTESKSSDASRKAEEEHEQPLNELTFRQEATFVIVRGVLTIAVFALLHWIVYDWLWPDVFNPKPPPVNLNALLSRSCPEGASCEQPMSAELQKQMRELSDKLNSG
eukprot:PLAT13480.1.p1 GENE.PLAT13480.1~~PLAT13480.1.p1  ORF type:complete len:182 (+),score=40.98 PLAT13480.1:26-547(+)